MAKFTIYATQKVIFSTHEIEAQSEEEAKKIYNDLWNDGDVSSEDYDEDSGEFIIKKA